MKFSIVCPLKSDAVLLGERTLRVLVLDELLLPVIGWLSQLTCHIQQPLNLWTWA